MKGFVRPPAIVLDESSIVPDKNIISPAPNQLTHELTRPQPYYFDSAQQAKPPDGEFPAGTKVVLLEYHGGDHCRVADQQGLYVEIEHGSLKTIA